MLATKKLLLLCLIFVFLLSFVALAAPPFQQSAEVTGNQILISYPKTDYFEAQTNFTLHFHVFNSTGFALNTTSTSCTIHLYDSMDAHVLKTIMPFDDEFDYEVRLNTTIISREGIYPYIVQCSNSEQAGFVSGAFEVSNQARSKSINRERVFASVVGLGILALFFLFFAFKLEEEHFLLKLFSIFFALFAIILIPSIILNEGSLKVLGLFYKVPLWFFGIFVTYISVYIFWHWVKQSQKLCDLFRVKKE